MEWLPEELTGQGRIATRRSLEGLEAGDEGGGEGSMWLTGLGGGRRLIGLKEVS